MEQTTSETPGIGMGTLKRMLEMYASTEHEAFSGADIIAYAPHRYALKRETNGWCETMHNATGV